MEGMSSMPASRFDYRELVQRNIGFVTEAEQERIRHARVFVCGVGGMGGACVMSLVRAGVSHLTIADIDRFEISNLNRQLFAFLDTIGSNKARVTRERLLAINPELQIRVVADEWTERVDEILAEHPVVVNGMDHVPSGILLYRKAREHGATVVDAYASPLPSVYVVRPGDPRPEERLGYPTTKMAWTDIGPEEEAACLLREIEYALVHSSSKDYVDLGAAAEMLSGARKRMSFAPMVVTAGNLMCFETISLVTGRPSACDHRGYFFNPWAARVERPRSWPVAAARRWLVRRFLRRLTHGT
jgi:molybdopterin/thiamine biosynthesis adenylyltransferase